MLSSRRELRAHAERAAINTPLQGGAADVVMKAMVLISRNERLKELGWKMLLQIHDELIVEGPEASKDEAMGILIRFPFRLFTSLSVYLIFYRNHRWHHEESVIAPSVSGSYCRCSRCTHLV